VAKFEFEKTKTGEYLLKVEDAARWPLRGFALFDGETYWSPLTYDISGLSWKVVEPSEVPKSVKIKLMRTK
jgi:hypothetical protein